MAFATGIASMPAPLVVSALHLAYLLNGHIMDQQPWISLAKPLKLVRCTLISSGASEELEEIAKLLPGPGSPASGYWFCATTLATAIGRHFRGSAPIQKSSKTFSSLIRLSAQALLC